MTSIHSTKHHEFYVFYMEVCEIDELDADWLTSLVTSMMSLLRAKPAAGSLMMSVLPSLVTDI